MLRRTAPTAVPDWVEELSRQGLRAYYTQAGHCWLRFRRWANMRYPPNDTAPLTPPELYEVLWRARMKIVQYVELESRAPNSYLYLCRDPNYSLDSLSANNRSKVRRGLKRMSVRQITPADVITLNGYASYHDTRRRHGVPHLSQQEFIRHWQGEVASDHREIWAALSDGKIAAFGTVHLCGRWAAITATVSTTSSLRDYPNHALFFAMLDHLMNERRMESASYGLSSLREETQQDSLHHFKTSIGLTALPVLRRIVVHPLLQPMINPATRAVLHRIAAARPQSRLPRAAAAAIDFLEDPGGPPAQRTGGRG